VGEIRVRGYIPKDNHPMTDAARELRRRQTEAERILWFKLRDNQLDGVKFRRQESIGSYIVDFVSFEYKLVIEIDGSPHKETITKSRDRQRTIWLRSEGFKVLRFWNGEIINDFDAVIRKVKANLKR
jgi:very-short-patch-repair endonuclease